MNSSRVTAEGSIASALDANSDAIQARLRSGGGKRWACFHGIFCESDWCDPCSRFGRSGVGLYHSSRVASRCAHAWRLSNPDGVPGATMIPLTALSSFLVG